MGRQTSCLAQLFLVSLLAISIYERREGSAGRAAEYSIETTVNVGMHLRIQCLVTNPGQLNQKDIFRGIFVARLIAVEPDQSVIS